MKITDRKVLITGAGSGIGRELALRFGSAGGALALVGRRADALEDTAAQIRAQGGTAHVVVADLADHSAPDAVVAAAVAHLGGLDVLIEDLGFGRRPVADVVADVVDDIIAGIEADRLEINTALESRRALQKLNRTDVAAVDEALRPRLAALRAAVSGHRRI